MTEFQLMHLRFLRMTQDMPHLNHRGHEPKATIEALINPSPAEAVGLFILRGEDMFTRDGQRKVAEREFYRLDPPRGETAETQLITKNHPDEKMIEDRGKTLLAVIVISFCLSLTMSVIIGEYFRQKSFFRLHPEATRMDYFLQRLK